MLSSPRDIGGDFVLLIECNDIKKYFGDRLLLDIEDLKIYSDDKIGIVGVNGVGKTTLINILMKRLEPDEGCVKLNCDYAFVSQLEESEAINISDEMASRFNISNTWNEDMSGGEKTRFKLASVFDKRADMLFADEPTSNLDINGIELLEKGLQDFNGALVIISHDRTLLDKVCNKIIEVSFGKIKIYNGNFSKYRELKEEEKIRAEFEYEQYISEKKRLEGVIANTRQKAASIKGAPKRMGNSEARLHKMGGQKAKKGLDNAVKNLRKRVEHLEVKEKPKEQGIINFDIQDVSRLHSKIIIEGRKISKAFDKKIIFKDAELNIYNGWKVALIGDNGCGKSTLIKMIMDSEDGIKVAKGAKVGYFSQDMNILDDEKSILENVMDTSIYDETFTRTLLARLLFRKEDVYKKVSLLSGGERVKVSFAKLMLQDINILILDEPTNYLDINSMEVVEEALRAYSRTIFFVSHDRSFVRTIADHIMTIENKKIKIFNGNLDEYLKVINRVYDYNKERKEQEIFILENKLSEIIGKLSMPSKRDDVDHLDKEYQEILRKLKKLKC